MKCVSLPAHDDQIHALLIEGPHHDSTSIFVPCRLSNGKEIRLGVTSDNCGLQIRRQPVLLLNGRAGPELAVVTMHIKRIVETKNVNPSMPLLFIDDHACIDLHENVPSDYVRGKLQGRVAYSYYEHTGRYAAYNRMRQLRISDQPINHPALDSITKLDLDSAYHTMRNAETSWSKLCDDHESDRLTIDLPGIELYLKYVPKQDRGTTLPALYAEGLKSFAGGLETPELKKKLDSQRQEMVNLIEMVGGLRSLIVEGVTLKIDGSKPMIVFGRNSIQLHLYVNELPIQGNYLVVDKDQTDFNKKFVTHETLAQAITAISTRMTYA